MLGQQSDVVAPLAQWRQFDFERAEPEVQIVPKLSSFHFLTQLLLRRGDYPEPRTQRRFRPRWPYIAMIQHAQQLQLQQ